MLMMELLDKSQGDTSSASKLAIDSCCAEIVGLELSVIEKTDKDNCMQLDSDKPRGKKSSGIFLHVTVVGEGHTKPFNCSRCFDVPTVIPFSEISLSGPSRGIKNSFLTTRFSKYRFICTSFLSFL